ERDARIDVDRAAGGPVRQFLAGLALAPSLELRVSRSPACEPRTRHESADRQLRGARTAPPHELPQIRGAQRRPRRLRVELALARQTSRTADAASRLDVLAVRRAALRDQRARALQRRRNDLVRRLSQDQRPPPPPAAQSP